MEYPGTACLTVYSFIFTIITSLWRKNKNGSYCYHNKFWQKLIHSLSVRLAILAVNQ